MRRPSVRGDREVVAALKELGRGVPVGDINRAARDAMKPMRDQTVQNARQHRNYVGKHPGFPQPDPGRDLVDKGIAVRKVARSGGKHTFWLGAVRRARSVLHLLEFGTAPHWQPNFRGGFLHPGARPKPVMTPAYEQHGDEVINDFGEHFWRMLQRRVLGLAMKGRR